MSRTLAITALTLCASSAIAAPALGNLPPRAAATATPTQGAAPLATVLDARGSNDPNPGDTLTYAWDLDGDGSFETDGVLVAHTFPLGLHTVRLRVSDAGGLSDHAAVDLAALNTPPDPAIALPDEDRWQIGRPLRLSGSASDPNQGPIPAAGLSWSAVLRECEADRPQECRTRPLPGANGTAEYVIVPPAAEYPAVIEATLRAVDEHGVETVITREIAPFSVDVFVDSDPSGHVLGVGSRQAAGPITQTLIAGDRLAIRAPEGIAVEGADMRFASWSDGGARAHEVLIPAVSQLSLIARYHDRTAPNVEAPAARPPLSAAGISGRDGEACAPGRFAASYYGNATFVGAPRVRRCDATLGGRWGLRRPAAGMPADGFSVEWTGRLRAAGRYRLELGQTDGARVWVDGRIVVNRRGSANGRLVFVVPAADSEIRVRFTHRVGAAKLVLSGGR